MKLNMGCGYNKREGYVNVDLSPACRPDVVFNLEETPWPWGENSVKEVVFTHCLEHLGGETKVFLGIVKELYRVCMDGAIIYISAPHPRHDNFIGDPTHVRIISPQILSLFNRELNDNWQRNGCANTPLAHYLGVDFVIKENIIVLEEPYLSQYQRGELSDENINMALREKNNVASEFNITMHVRKTSPDAETSFTPQNDSITDSINIAIQHHNAGCFSEAEKIYRNVLTIITDSAEIYKNYGNTLLCLGQTAEAEKAYRQALVLNPDYAEAYNNLGNVLRLEGRLEEAEQAFRRAVALLPDSADVHNNFGNVLMNSGRVEEAERAYRKAIVLKPDHAMAYNNRGNALLALKQWEVAEKSYRKALSLKQDYVEAYCGLGNALFNIGRTDEAEQAYQKALVIKPDYAEAHCGLGNLFKELVLLEKAERAYRQALLIKPDFAMAQYNLSLLKLLQGKYEEGFEFYEKRFDGMQEILNAENLTAIIRNQVNGYSFWQGEPLEGVTLSILTEQGAGDTLMMMRYLTLLKHKGLKRLIVYSVPTLRRVLQSLPDVDEVVSDEGPLPCGLYCPMLSLPHLFKTSLESVPGNVPYLNVPEEMKQKWRSRFAGMTGKKVGLVWAGGKLTGTDKIRSIPLSRFASMREIDGVNLVSLQKGEEAIQLTELGWDLFDQMDECEDFLDTAALVNELDLVISVDTSVAHLAGALGIYVWLLNRFESEWRWMLDREDSPWYPTMRIFRQKTRGDWDGVLSLVMGELVEFARISDKDRFS
jgi:tetratricopeptide (TPR) repeat protein